jgi:hypothetical protein
MIACIASLTIGTAVILLMNGTVRLPDCPPRGHERSRVERLLPLTRVTRISYRERTIQ